MIRRNVTDSDMSCLHQGDDAVRTERIRSLQPACLLNQTSKLLDSLLFDELVCPVAMFAASSLADMCILAMISLRPT
jgi:hypothetical protein